MSRKPTLDCQTLATVAMLSLLQFSLPANAAEEAHPHHVAVAAGGAWNGSKTAGYLGADYVYRFQYL